MLKFLTRISAAVNIFKKLLDTHLQNRKFCQFLTFMFKDIKDVKRMLGKFTI